MQSFYGCKLASYRKWVTPAEFAEKFGASEDEIAVVTAWLTSLGTQILTITTAGSDGTNTVRHDFQYQVTVQ